MTKYLISFTAGALMFDETVRVLEFILNETLEFEKNFIIEKNIIKVNSEAGRKRVLQEIRKRSKAVDKSIWELFNQSNKNEKKIILFYVVLKTYQIVFDFMREVILEKWKSLTSDFSERDIEIFLDKKIIEHPEIEIWTETTRAKVIQVIIRILKEAGILINNKIEPIIANYSFWKHFVKIGDPWFLELALLNKQQRDKIYGNII